MIELTEDHFAALTQVGEERIYLSWPTSGRFQPPQYRKKNFVGGEQVSTYETGKLDQKIFAQLKALGLIRVSSDDSATGTGSKWAKPSYVSLTEAGNKKLEERV